VAGRCGPGDPPGTCGEGHSGYSGELKRIGPRGLRNAARSKYGRHQGARECVRRLERSNFNNWIDSGCLIGFREFCSKGLQ
jgi:hypothetical protein